MGKGWLSKWTHAVFANCTCFVCPDSSKDICCYSAATSTVEESAPRITVSPASHQIMYTWSGISVCKTSWNGSPLSPLIALGTPIWCLFRTRRSSCPRWGGCPSWSGLRVSPAGGLYQRSKGLRVEGRGRPDPTGLMSAHKFQYKLLLQQDIFLRYEDLWQHQSLFQQVRRRLAFWFHKMSSRNVKERFWAELQRLSAILHTKLSGKRNTQGSCFLCLTLDHHQSPLNHDSFSQFSPAQQLFPLPLHLSKDLKYEKWRNKKRSWLAGTSHGFPPCHRALCLHST